MSEGQRETLAQFEVNDELWAKLESCIAPVSTPREGSFRAGRKPVHDRAVLNGILHVLRTGIAWDDLPQHYGYGSGLTCWRRLRQWRDTGTWDALHQRLHANLETTDTIDWARATTNRRARTAHPSPHPADQNRD